MAARDSYDYKACPGKAAAKLPTLIAQSSARYLFISLLILTLIVAAFLEQQKRRADEATKAGRQVERGLLVDVFVVGELATNCILIGDKETRRAAIVDPGGSLPAILEHIRKWEAHVEHIIVTHGHFDHILAAGALKELTGATIWIPENDGMLWQMLPQQCMFFQQPPPAKALPQPDKTFKHGDKLPLLNGQVIHTPGHSPGSSCFYFPDHKVLLSGDTLFRQGCGRTDLLLGDSGALVQSIKNRLYQLPDDTRVIPGHGPETTIGFEKQSNPFVRA